MQQYQAITACVYLLATFLMCANAYCYQSAECVNTDTGKSYKNGDSWQTSKCEKCYCFSRKSSLQTCYEEYVPEYKPRNIKKSVSFQAVAHLETSEPVISPKAVFVPKENASDFSCPPFPEAVFDLETQTLTLPHLQEVLYFTETQMVDCCSMFGYPVNIHPSCKSIWRQKECKYDVVERSNTTTPCFHSYGMIGK